MTAKRKKKKSKTKRISFKPGSLSKKKKRKVGRFGPALIGILKVSAVVCSIAAVVVILYFAEKYVKSSNPVETGPIELAETPEWVSEQLRAKILAAVGGKTFRLDENAAYMVANNLASVAWLDEVKVETTDKSILVTAEFRKPIALIKSALDKFYVDVEQVVLDFVPMPNLPIVEIKGLSSISKTPPLGKVWHRDDLAAAILILERLDQRDKDKSVRPDKPLLDEIGSIDVSNFNGQQSTWQPHIVLYTTDNTQIIWGAEIGKWQQHLESTDEEKLAKLYGYYKEYGTLLGGAKYINLRDPQDKIPLPIDRY